MDDGLGVVEAVSLFDVLATLSSWHSSIIWELTGTASLDDCQQVPFFDVGFGLCTKQVFGLAHVSQANGLVSLRTTIKLSSQFSLLRNCSRRSPLELEDDARRLQMSHGNWIVFEAILLPVDIQLFFV